MSSELQSASPQESSSTDITIPSNTSTSALVLDAGNFDQMERLAKIMATGRSTIPKHLRGNVGDCMAVVMQAVQWRMSPYSVATKTHFVNDNIGYEAQLVNAVINSMAPTKDRIHYEWFGPWEKVIGKFEIRKNKEGIEYRTPGWALKDEDGIGIKVWATLKGEDEPRELTLLLAQARTRNSPLWADDPRQQLAYLAVKRWARLYTPDVIMGVYTPDEFDGYQPPKDLNQPARNAKPAEVASRKNQSAQPQLSPELLANAQAAADQGRESFKAYWKAIRPVDRAALRDEVSNLEERVKSAESRTIDAEEKPKHADAPPPADDEFAKGLDAAGSDYVPE